MRQTRGRTLATDSTQEFRKYRQALLTIYVVALGLGSLLILVSVAVELFGRRNEPATVGTPADLLHCNQDVSALLESLGREVSTLQVEAFVGDARDLGARWEEFTREWQKQWDVAEARCLFNSRADKGLGPAFDRMAWVHRQLPRLKLEYRESMKRFENEQAREIASMRAALAKSRELLEERAGDTSPP